MINFNYSKIIGVMLSTGLLVTFAALPSARGELVYDNPAQRTDDRAELRQVLNSSQKARAVEPVLIANVVRAPSPVQVQVPVQVQPEPETVVVAEANVAPPLENLSKSELMRRERVREEVKNEDILQERLEELRLRDERRRTGELLSASNGVNGAASQTAVQSVSSVSDEVVVAPVTEHSGQSAPRVTINGGNAAVSLASSEQAPIGLTTAVSSEAVSISSDDATSVGISPRLGFSDMSGNQAFNVYSRYTTGVSLDVGVSDMTTFEIGYSFSEYGVAIASTNPWVTTYQGWTGNYNGNFETQAMKQNVFDAGIKLHLLKSDFRFRPFIGGGAGYSKSFINYDTRIIDFLNSNGLSNMSRDYEVSSVLGYLSTGFDVRLSKGVSIGTSFKYYSVLTARENENLNGAAFTGYPGASGYSGYNYNYQGSAYPYYQQPADIEKARVGGSLARSSFYSVTAGVSFTF